MTAIGGSIESVSIRGRIFPVAADNDVTLKLGGFENEVASNGNGSARIIKTRMPWSLEGVQIEVDHSRADQEHLQEVADGQEYVPCAITFASGVTYSGKAILTEMAGYSTQSTTATITLMGEGKATQQ